MKRSIKSTIISSTILATLIGSLTGCKEGEVTQTEDSSTDSVVEVLEEETVLDEAEIEEESITIETIKAKVVQLEPQIMIIDEENQQLLSASNSIDISNIKSGDLVDVEYIKSTDNSDTIEIMSINTYYKSTDFINAYIALFDVIKDNNSIGFDELSQYETIALDMTWVDGMTDMEKDAFVKVLKQKLNNNNINIVFGNQNQLITDGHMIVESDSQGPEKRIIPNGIYMAFSIKKLGSSYTFATTYYYPDGISGNVYEGDLNYDESLGTYTYTVFNSAG